MSPPELDIFSVEDSVAGPLKEIVVRGGWTEIATNSFWAEGCNAVQWYPSRDDSRDSQALVGLSDVLVALTITCRGSFDDSAVAKLAQLRSLSLNTRAKNPIDLGRLTKLKVLYLDDRPCVTGWELPDLQLLSLAYTARPLSDLQQLTALTSLTLEGRRHVAIDLSACLPNLEWLRLIGVRIDDLSGLEAPSLQELRLETNRVPDVLDLAPAAQWPRLAKLIVDGPLRVRNILDLLARPGFELYSRKRLGLPAAEHDQLPEYWNRAGVYPFQDPVSHN